MDRFSVRVLKEINFGQQLELSDGRSAVVVDFYSASKAKKIVIRTGVPVLQLRFEADKELVRQQLIEQLDLLPTGGACVELPEKKEAGRSTSTVVLYSDGGAAPNPGPGGWGVVVVYPDGSRQEKAGYDPSTTNNRMELSGVIHGLELLDREQIVEVWVDSTYVKNGITKWIHGWKKNGWLTASKQSVKNSDLWRELDQLVAGRNITWHWVRGHSGHPENERCDQLVREARERRSGL